MGRADPVADVEVLAVLRSLVGKVDTLSDQVAELRAGLAARQAPGAADASMATLLHCISEAIGPRLFSTWELADYAQLRAGDALRVALVAAVGDAENANKIGRRLAKVEGVDMDGRTVVRDGLQNGVARWRVVG